MAEIVDSTAAPDVPAAAPAQRAQDLVASRGGDRGWRRPTPPTTTTRACTSIANSACSRSSSACSKRPQDERNKLLERVKFLAIVASNLAEFFMVRVAGLKEQIESGVSEVSADGMTPAEQLAQIRLVSQTMMNDSRVCLDGLLGQLRDAGIHVLDYDALDARQRAVADGYFNEIVFPVLTPLAVDPGRPFPHISNMSLSIAVFLRDEDGDEQFARVKVPDTLPRLVRVPPPEGETESARASTIWSGSIRWSAAISTCCSRGWRSWSTRRSAWCATPRWRSRNSRPRTCSRPSSAGVRSRRFGSVVRLTVRIHHVDAYARHPDREPRHRARRRVRGRSAARLDQPVGTVRSRSPRSQGRGVHPGGAGRLRQDGRARYLRGDPQAGRAAARAVRLVQPGAGLPRVGGSRSRTCWPSR